MMRMILPLAIGMVLSINSGACEFAKLSYDRDSLSIGRVSLDGGGAQWFPKRFEIGKKYKFCFALPVLNVDREASYAHFRDLLHLSIMPLSKYEETKMFIRLTAPNGKRFVVRGSGPSSRDYFIKYRKEGIWVLEFMVESGWNEYVIVLKEMFSNVKFNAVSKEWESKPL